MNNFLSRTIYLQLRENDELSNGVCTACIGKLVEFHLFRRQIVEAHKRLMSAVETDSDANEHAADDAVTSVDVKDEKPQAANAACDRRRVCHKGKTAVSKDNRVQKTRTENTSVAQDIQENLSIVGEASTRKRYICDKCETVFSYPSRFLSHYRRSHLKEFQRKICPYCPRAFTLSTSGNYLLRLAMYIFD